MLSFPLFLDVASCVFLMMTAVEQKNPQYFSQMTFEQKGEYICHMEACSFSMCCTWCHPLIEMLYWSTNSKPVSSAVTVSVQVPKPIQSVMWHAEG
jgi:hypothetical protein